MMVKKFVRATSTRKKNQFTNDFLNIFDEKVRPIVALLEIYFRANPFLTINLHTIFCVH